MDGGVIDNVPISRAIRAIANSPADGRVRRVLLYLHPDPGGRRGSSAGRDPTTALQVVQSFFGKRKETIREDIELLRSHNDAVERRRDEGDSLLKSFADPHYSADDRERATLAQSINAAMLLRAAIDPPSELTWHAPNVARLVPLVDDPQDPSKAELAADIDQVVGDPDVLVAVATRRIVLALQRIISSIGAAAPEVDFRQVQPKVYELSLLCDVITSYQLARFLGHGTGSAPTTRLSLSRRELDDILVDDELDDETWNALASWDLSGATHVAGGHRLGDHLAQLVTKLIEQMPDPPKGLRLPAAEVLEEAEVWCREPAGSRSGVAATGGRIGRQRSAHRIRSCGRRRFDAGIRGVQRLRQESSAQDRRPAAASPRRVLRSRLENQRLVVGTPRQRASPARCRARSRGGADHARQGLSGGTRL